MPIRAVAGPLQDQAFRRLFVARAVSDAGSSVATVAYAFAILDLTGSASDLGFAFVARTVPVLIFVLIGGALADRFPRRRMMIGADTVRAVSQGAVATLLLTGHARLWELIALQLVYGCGEAVFTPASRGLVPQVVGGAQLQRANALLSFSRNTNGIVGPAVGGLLVALVQPGAALAVDAGSFAVGSLLLLGVAVRTLPTPSVEREPVWSAIAVGWRAVRDRAWLSVSLAGDCVFQFIVLSSLFVLGPTIAKDKLHGAASWASFLVALGVGSLVGDAVSMRIRPRRPLLTSRLAIVGLAPAMLLLASGASTWVVAAAFVVAGIAFSVTGTLWFTLLQQNVPDHLRSRISSFDTLVSRALLPLGYGFVGVAAGQFGAATVLATAASTMVVVQLGIAALPSVRGLGAVEYAPAETA